MNKGIINIIDFNEPKNKEDLKTKFEKGCHPAFFRFDLQSTDLLIEYGNQYIKYPMPNNQTLWLLKPKEPIEPNYAILPGEEQTLKVVSTESDPNINESDPDLNSDITLIFNAKTSINLKDFQSYVHKEMLSNEEVMQR